MERLSHFVARLLAPRIEAALADTPVVLVVGPRQAGKTTLCQHIAGHAGRRTLSLDDAATHVAAQTDPEAFIDAIEGPVLIDEIQRAPELLRAIKRAVDRDRRSGRFLLTGSANVLALPRVSESLAGRMEILALWPLAQCEIERRAPALVDSLFSDELRCASGTGETRSSLFERMLRGGFPEVLGRGDEARRGAWFGSYVTTITQRDVRDIVRVEDLTAVPRLLAFLAARSGSVLNIADLARAVGLAHPTLTRHLALLEMTFLVRRILPWAAERGRRLVRTPRIVLTDSGLAAHLAGISARRLDAEPTIVGPLLETFVAMELVKQIGASRTRTELLHFRTHRGREVDLVLEADDGRVVGIEVKGSTRVGPEDLRGLAALREIAGKRFHRGVVLYAGQEVLPLGPDLFALPLSAL